MTARRTAPRSTPIVDTTRSPFAMLRPVPVGAVHLQDSLWAPRRERVRTVTMRQQYEQCEETGRLDNFRRAAGTYDGPFQGRYFNDSDVYKWIEAGAWLFATGDDPDLRAKVDAVVALIAAAQDADGYLNTYFTFERKDERWTDLAVLHELYCAGHLIQGAVAMKRATGDDAFLDVAIGVAANIDSVFGPDKRRGSCGHPEIELALVELHRETGERRWLDLARFFLDQRGQEPSTIGHYEDWRRERGYFQDHALVVDQREAVGHAVRALYLYSGATDLVLETGDEAYRAAIDALWHDFQTRNVYVTGGAGSRHDQEAFGRAYELGNERAYAETCATIAHAMWAWRLLLLTGDARYADAMETAFYNGMLSGLSFDGDLYFYVNPLEDDGHHRRQPWFGTACCPPNIARTLAALPGYLYSTSDDGIWVHLYAENAAEVDLGGGQTVELRQRTAYPWDGAVSIQVTGIDAPSTLSLFLRIPAWCEAGARIEVNGERMSIELTPGSYAEIRREWAAGDTVRLDLPMPIQLVECHPWVAENLGRVAVTRGPLVYCAEAVDNPGVDVRDVVLAPSPVGASTATFQPDLLGGLTTLALAARHVPSEPAWSDRLYRTAGAAPAADAGAPVTLTAVPYFAWANREAGPMRVWLRSEA